MAKKDSNTVMWWIGWILLTLLSFFVSCWFWTSIIARQVGPMTAPGAKVLWITAVFGTWMALLVPLIVIMYSKVDRAYEDARMARETKEYGRARQALGIRFAGIEQAERMLPKPLRSKLKAIPETIRKGHLVTAVLKDGTRFENVFVLNKKEVLGIYGADKMPFRVEEIVDLESAACIPDFKAEKWLRLDGGAETLP